MLKPKINAIFIVSMGLGLAAAPVWATAAHTKTHAPTRLGEGISELVESQGQRNEDHHIVLSVNHELNKIEGLRKARVMALCHDGVLVLLGEAPSFELKRMAEESAARVANVKKIYNEINIAEPISMQTQAVDALVTTKLKAKIYKDKEIRNTHVTVATENGCVYLIGEADSKQAKRLIDEARRTDDVKRVVTFFNAA